MRKPDELLPPSGSVLNCLAFPMIHYITFPYNFLSFGNLTAHLLPAISHIKIPFLPLFSPCPNQYGMVYNRNQPTSFQRGPLQRQSLLFSVVLLNQAISKHQIIVDTASKLLMKWEASRAGNMVFHLLLHWNNFTCISNRTIHLSH